MAKSNHYLSFSKRERTGIIILLFLIVVLFLLPEFIPPKVATADMKAAAEFEEEVASLKMHETNPLENEEKGSDTNADSHNEKRKPVLFYFDPNTISADEWKNLGISERTTQTIKNYISKGGRFRKPEDLGKIFGLPKPQYQRLLPFVRIPAGEQTAFSSVLPRNKKAFTTSANRTATIIDINLADTSGFIALPGIGSKLANRIIAFREKLGGFHTVDQVKETYGLQDSTFVKILPFLKCDASMVRQLNINTVDVATLGSHPYFKWNLANAIVNYRKEHGEYKEVEDLLQINIIPERTFQKLAPYCKVR